MKIGALEAGGTKMVCAVGNEEGEILKKITIPTETPRETMPKMLDFFEQEQVEALGIGCFGPINPVKGTPITDISHPRPKSPGKIMTSWVPLPKGCTVL